MSNKNPTRQLFSTLIFSVLTGAVVLTSIQNADASSTEITKIPSDFIGVWTKDEKVCRDIKAEDAQGGFIAVLSDSVHHYESHCKFKKLSITQNPTIISGKYSCEIEGNKQNQHIILRRQGKYLFEKTTEGKNVYMEKYFKCKSI